MADYKEAWLQKARIDYFSPFISLWLACNSWYRTHYSDIIGNDREFINTLKKDFTGRNHLYTNFKKTLLGERAKNDVSLKSSLEMLNHSLGRVAFKPERLLGQCSFSNFLIDYSKKDDVNAYDSIIITPTFKKNGEITAEYESKVVRLNEIYIISDFEKVFAGLFETIYQIRNMVVYGHVKPEKDEHEVIKYCYLILSDMMGIGESKAS